MDRGEGRSIEEGMVMEPTMRIMAQEEGTEDDTKTNTMRKTSTRTEDGSDDCLNA